MCAISDPYSDRVVRNILELCVAEFAATSAALLWYGDGRTGRPRSLNLPSAFLGRHSHPHLLGFADIHEPFRLRIDKLAHARSRLEFWRRHNGTLSANADPAYQSYLDKVEIYDELDMLFWHNDKPVCALALFRDRSGSGFLSDHRRWDLIRRHVECSLLMHSRFRAARLEDVLTNRYGLTPTEIKIVHTLMTGATNFGIAERLNLRLTTVKTYLYAIFNKMGVDNRGSVISIVSPFSFPYDDEGELPDDAFEISDIASRRGYEARPAAVEHR